MEIVEKEETLEKVRLLDKKTNKLLADKIVTLPYFENLEMVEIFSNYSIFIAHDLYTQLNYEGLYCVTNNMLYIDASFINIEVMLHEKIHMITSSIKDKKIGYQDDKTDETFHFSNYLNESATEWLKCKILYGENFLKKSKYTVHNSISSRSYTISKICQYIWRRKNVKAFLSS